MVIVGENCSPQTSTDQTELTRGKATCNTADAAIDLQFRLLDGLLLSGSGQVHTVLDLTISETKVLRAINGKSIITRPTVYHTYSIYLMSCTLCRIMNFSTSQLYTQIQI